MAFTFERLEWNSFVWRSPGEFEDRLVLQTREWLSFIAAAYGATPVICSVLEGGERVGFFTGLFTRRFGIRILGSPMPGWTTPYIGFNLAEDISRSQVLDAFLPYAHSTLGCAHVEVRDRLLPLESTGNGRVAWEPYETLELDLEPDEDELFGRMTSACRRAIRKAEKVGVTMEEASDAGFADDYYEQLKDVFAKQSLSPKYSVATVRALIEHVYPTGNVLLLRARSAEGESIATGIFPGLNKTAYFWGGASWREHQILRPNEAMFWYAMRYWKSRGATAMDLGAGEYKRKYGVRDVTVPHVVSSRLPGLRTMRRLAKVMYSSERLRRVARVPTRSR